MRAGECTGPGKPPRAQGTFQFPASVLGLGASMCTSSSKVESPFPTALQQDILVFKPAKGLSFPVSGPRAAVPNTGLGPIAP